MRPLARRRASPLDLMLKLKKQTPDVDVAGREKRWSQLIRLLGDYPVQYVPE